MPLFTVGCDPEIFVSKNGKLVSAYGLIDGDKKHPYKVYGGAVQVDGMALEFNTLPAIDVENFVWNINEVMAALKKMVPNHEFEIIPVAHFDEEYFKQQPKEALELGCDPDYNAWTGIVNDKPDCTRPMRTASGHVHIGWMNSNFISNETIHRAKLAGKQMDFYLGLPSLFWDDDIERREMYGKAGCIRFKPYGVEYRTLSNAWLKSDELKTLVFNNLQTGMKDLVKGNILAKKYGDIQEIINNSDKKEAKKIINAENIPMYHG